MSMFKKILKHQLFTFLFVLMPNIVRANVIVPTIVSVEETIYDILEVLVIIIVIVLIENSFAYYLFKKKFSFRYTFFVILIANIISTLFGFYLLMFKLGYVNFRLFSLAYLLSGLIEGVVMFMFLRKKFGFGRIMLISYLVNFISYLLLYLFVFAPYFLSVIFNIKI